MRLTIHPESSALATAAAAHAAGALADAVAQRGSAFWVLAGGTSPLAAYRELAARHQGSLDWSRVTGIIGDERCVPLDHADSNTGQIIAALSNAPGIGAMRLLIPKTQGNPSACARDYASEIREAWAETSEAKFAPDLVWLGMGEDGHTLSHFPGRASLSDGSELVIAVVDSPKPPAERITLSIEAVGAARRAIVFAVGAAKRDALHSVVRSSHSLPVGVVASTIEAAGGVVDWFADTAVVLPPAA